MNSHPKFFMQGPCDDAAYRNTRDHPRGAEAKQFVEDLWSRFQHLADRHCRADARNHFLARFWEMYLAVALIDRGIPLTRSGSEGPDFCGQVRGRRVWFEAVAPGPGTGADQVPQLKLARLDDGEPLEFEPVPTEKILLRFTNALDTKRQRYAEALAKGIISPADSYVLAINSRGIRWAPDSGLVPDFLQAFLGIGPLVVYFDVPPRKNVDAEYRPRPLVSKENAEPVSTAAFLDQSAGFCSAVLHSGVDCANHPDRLGEDFAVLHNPNAQCPLDEGVFQWCKQFRVADGTLKWTDSKSCSQWRANPYPWEA